MKRALGFVNCRYIKPIGLGGGLALWWNLEVDIKFNLTFENVLDTIIVQKVSGLESRITWVYASCEYSKRIQN